MSAKKQDQGRRTIRIDEDVYRELKKLRTTDRGTVSYNEVLRWMIQKVKKLGPLKEES